MMGITKGKLILVFGGMIAIWLFSYGMHLYETRDSLRIENILLQKIDFIEVSDRGLVDTARVILKDSVPDYWENLLSSSKRVKFDDINFHANQGLCDLVVHYKNKQIAKLSLVKTPFMHSNILHGILNSGQLMYQNDSLLNVLITKLKMH